MLDWPGRFGMLEGAMSAMFSASGAEFIENYQRDAPLRWSPEDLVAQQGFVNPQVTGRDWLDWSTPGAALQLVQAIRSQTSVGTEAKYEAVVLAGPVAELVEPDWLFREAALPLVPGGRLVGIVPCLRDNSPESQAFADLAVETLWPYYTVEDLLEMLSESGWRLASPAAGFVPIARFNDAVLKDQLGFKGFTRIFERLAARGYDPMEIGWGELRLSATWPR